MRELQPNTITIRPATCKDIEVLVEFNCLMAWETEQTELARRMVTAGVQALLDQPQRGFYLVAEQLGRVVGALMVTTEWSDWRNGVFWWIQSVYVRGDCRRQGVFRQLYGDVQQRARTDPQVCGFRLYVERNNAIAQQTYAAMGMTETAYRMFEQLKDRST
jgi:ribosomal protein S18 acetylase RimI-like enzyme